MAPRKPVLGNHLALLSRGEELSDLVIAARAGITRAQLNRIRNGRAIPRLDTAILLARALGCRVKELFYLRASRGRPAGPT